MTSRDQHARWRALAASALDGPLPAEDADGLRRHLAACAACRSAARDYRDQRQALRGLPARTPPRDMWARTSAALDREVARDSRSFGRHAYRRRGFVAGLAATLGVTAISFALVGTQSIPRQAAAPASTAQAAVLRPTPFTIPSEALAYVGSGIEGLSVYRTRVDRVCPAAAIDCVDYPESPPSVVALPRDLRPNNVALSPNGARLAIQARQRDGGQTIAVAVIPADIIPEAPGAGAAGTPTADVATPTVPPASEPPPTPTATPANASPRLVPVASPSALPSPGVSTAAPSITVVMPSAAAGGGETVVAILEDVIAVGAAPAWSGDGTALAFSAMPADASHGPDVYIWRPSDARAQPLTNDHNSYFASWAGRRVVASRIASPGASKRVAASDAAEADDAGATPAARTPAPGDDSEPSPAIPADRSSTTIVVVDPVTGEERETAGADLWLPNVSPDGTYVVAWRGTLDTSSTEARAVSGDLFVAEWSMLDPFARAGIPTGGSSSVLAPSGEPDRTPPGEADEAGGPAPSDGDATDATEATDATDASAPPATAPPVLEPAVDLVPIEPAADTPAGSVQDWQVRWSPDGSVVGYWIADVPGANWGRLTVVGIDPASGALAHDSPLLAPTLARRTFTLGVNRVAWVGPTDDEPEGELRIRTWGPDGFGGLGLRPIQPGDVVPAS